ncbi:MAG: GHKL domain-containing protein [Lachnospiraceae bacterium]|nr:GHKL domain-containing protein [Lachnospiraceae bacterium]
MMYIFIVGALILVNLAVWALLIPYLTKKRANAFQEDLVNRHYDEVETMYRKMRGWRHDYHNHIQVLKAYFAQEQYAQAAGYLDMLEQDLTQVDTVIKTGNMMVDAILNSKLTLMKEKKIRVDATAFVPKELTVAQTDLAVLVGNLLDNAMEACEKVTEEERFVRIYMDVLKGQFYLCVTNSMQGKATRVGGLFSSAKSREHGFGLAQVKSLVEQYSGYLNMQTEDGVFAVELGIPLSTGKAA